MECDEAITPVQGEGGQVVGVDPIGDELCALDPPSQLLCPITYELMQSPVTCVGDGLTYSEAALRRHFRERMHAKQLLTSPLTNATLQTTMVTANHFARTTIETWLRDNVSTGAIARFRVVELTSRAFVALSYDHDCEVAAAALLAARTHAADACLAEDNEEFRRLNVLEHYLKFFNCIARTPERDIWRLAIEHAAFFGVNSGQDKGVNGESEMLFEEDDDNDDDDDEGGRSNPPPRFLDDADGDDPSNSTVSFLDNDVGDDSDDDDYVPPITNATVYATLRPRTRSTGVGDTDSGNLERTRSMRLRARGGVTPSQAEHHRLR